MSDLFTSPFINEPIEPELSAPKGGLVSAPTAFTWRDQRFEIQSAQMSKGFGSDRTHNSPERYLDKQWFACQLNDGRTAMIYFERRSRGGRHRWWLYSLEI